MLTGSAHLKSQNASPDLHVPVFSGCLKLILNFFFWIDISASSVMVFGLFVCLFFCEINHSLTISLSLPLKKFFFLLFLVVYFSLRKLYIPSFHLFRL